MHLNLLRNRTKNRSVRRLRESRSSLSKGQREKERESLDAVNPTRRREENEEATPREILMSLSSQKSYEGKRRGYQKAKGEGRGYILKMSTSMWLRGRRRPRRRNIKGWKVA